jgi:hypothetical protein
MRRIVISTLALALGASMGGCFGHDEHRGEGEQREGEHREGEHREGEHREGDHGEPREGPHEGSLQHSEQQK